VEGAFVPAIKLEFGGVEVSHPISVGEASAASGDCRSCTCCSTLSARLQMDLLFARLNLERLDMDLDMQELDLRTLAPECVRSVNGRLPASQRRDKAMPRLCQRRDNAVITL